MIGIELPVLAMEHMYLVTEPMAEVTDHNAAHRPRDAAWPSTSPARSTSARSRAGCCSGTYEQACVPWSPKDTPWDFEMQLLEPDLDRIAPVLEMAFKHYPAMATAGIKTFVNGPFTFSPDGNPLVGPDPGHAQLLGGLRGDGRAVAGRRRRSGPGQLDGRGRSRRRHLGDGRRPLRRLRHARLHQRQGPRELQPPVPHHVPERGAAGGSPAAHHADLRPAHRAQRRVGCVVRAGARAVVPAPGRGAGRGGDVPPLQRLPPGGRGVRGGARAGRPDGDLELRQVPRDRAGRGRRGSDLCSPTGCPRSDASC